uniref:CCHC-type domain-containing protein n=1 Tax=Strongyloides papillosus TaxID=174720 RepID=A0A0N5BQI6_STREA
MQSKLYLGNIGDRDKNTFRKVVNLMMKRHDRGSKIKAQNTLLPFQIDVSSADKFVESANKFKLLLNQAGMRVSRNELESRLSMLIGKVDYDVWNYFINVQVTSTSFDDIVIRVCDYLRTRPVKRKEVSKNVGSTFNLDKKKDRDSEKERKPIVCHFCREEGHIKPQCPKLKSSQDKDDKAVGKSNMKSSRVLEDMQSEYKKLLESFEQLQKENQVLRGKCDDYVSSKVLMEEANAQPVVNVRNADRIVRDICVKTKLSTKVNAIVADAMLDCGSHISIVSESIARVLGYRNNNVSDHKFYVANGSVMDNLGEFKIKVSFEGDCDIFVKFVVLKDSQSENPLGRYRLLLGNDVLYGLKISIDFERFEISVMGRKIQSIWYKSDANFKTISRAYIRRVTTKSVSNFKDQNHNFYVGKDNVNNDHFENDHVGKNRIINDSELIEAENQSNLDYNLEETVIPDVNLSQ